MLSIPILAATLFQNLLKSIAKWIADSPMTFVLTFVVLITILIGITAFSFNLGWSFLTKAFNVTPNISVVDSRSIVTSIKPLGQLVTVSYQMASADTHVQINRGLLNACQQSAKFAYVVEVQAGTNLKGINESSVVYDEELEVYTITLPPPVLTSCNVYENYSRFQTFMPSDFSTCDHHTDNEFNSLGEFQVINSSRDKAISDGILESAKRDNEQTLTTFLGAITDKEIQLQYSEIEPIHASSCNPAIPDGWNYAVDANGKSFWTPN